jgi:hypothetical protein
VKSKKRFASSILKQGIQPWSKLVDIYRYEKYIGHKRYIEPVRLRWINGLYMVGVALAVTLQKLAILMAGTFTLTWL